MKRKRKFETSHHHHHHHRHKKKLRFLFFPSKPIFPKEGLLISTPFYPWGPIHQYWPPEKTHINECVMSGAYWKKDILITLTNRILTLLITIIVVVAVDGTSFVLFSERIFRWEVVLISLCFVNAEEQLIISEWASRKAWQQKARREANRYLGSNTKRYLESNTKRYLRRNTNRHLGAIPKDTHRTFPLLYGKNRKKKRTTAPERKAQI